MSHVLRTARLDIRQVTEDDREQFVELFGNKDFMVFSEFGALDLEAANRRFDRMMAVYDELPFGKQAVIERSSGRLIGYAGCEHIDLDGERRLEFGYRLAEEARGCGYATEASRALLDLAARTYRGEVVALIEPANDPSRNVLRKLGFEFVDEVVVRGFDCERYRIMI